MERVCRVGLGRGLSRGGHRQENDRRDLTMTPGRVPLSCCHLMVIAQESAQWLVALNMPVAANVRTPREQQDIALPLMIPLGMEMFDIFPQRAPQGALAKEDHLGQALLLH